MTSLSEAYGNAMRSAPQPPSFNEPPPHPQHTAPVPPPRDDNGGGGSENNGPFATITGKEPFNVDPNGMAVPINPVPTQHQLMQMAPQGQADQGAIHRQKMHQTRLNIDNRFRQICREEQKGVTATFAIAGAFMGGLLVLMLIKQNSTLVPR